VGQAKNWSCRRGRKGNEHEREYRHKGEEDKSRKEGLNQRASTYQLLFKSLQGIGGRQLTAETG
jgi:hypothetical protein